MSIMIALVSEQRMQNIIPVFQKHAHFEAVWLVRSTEADNPQSRFGTALRDTRNALMEAGLQVHSAEPSVGAYGIEETRRMVSELISGTHSADVVVNFTGGTKCMSVGAYLAAQAAGIPAIYVDTANEKIVWFYADGQVVEKQFDLEHRLTVRVYLHTYDRQIDEERTRRHGMPESYFNTAQELVSLWPDCRETLYALEVAISQNRNILDGQVSEPTIDVLFRYGLVERTTEGWRPTKAGRNFLGGKWLDAMTACLLTESNMFDDVQPELRLYGVENELDAMITRNGQLAVFECKSGDLGGQAMLNKLQAIRSGLGTFVRAFFVTSRDANQVDKDFSDRASQYGFRNIITADTLLQIAPLVRDSMSGTPT